MPILSRADLRITCIRQHLLNIFGEPERIGTFGSSVNAFYLSQNTLAEGCLRMRAQWMYSAALSQYSLTILSQKALSEWKLGGCIQVLSQNDCSLKMQTMHCTARIQSTAAPAASHLTHTRITQLQAWDVRFKRSMVQVLTNQLLLTNHFLLFMSTIVIIQMKMLQKRLCEIEPRYCMRAGGLYNEREKKKKRWRRKKTKRQRKRKKKRRRKKQGESKAE